MTQPDYHDTNSSDESEATESSLLSEKPVSLTEADIFFFAYEDNLEMFPIWAYISDEDRQKVKTKRQELKLPEFSI